VPHSVSWTVMVLQSVTGVVKIWGRAGAGETVHGFKFQRGQESHGRRDDEGGWNRSGLESKGGRSAVRDGGRIDGGREYDFAMKDVMVGESGSGARRANHGSQVEFHTTGRGLEAAPRKTQRNPALRLFTCERWGGGVGGGGGPEGHAGRDGDVRERWGQSAPGGQRGDIALGLTGSALFLQLQKGRWGGPWA